MEKNFKTVKEMARIATGAEPVELNAPKEAPKEKKKTEEKTEKRHINVVIKQENFLFLNAFSKISGLNYGEILDALLERAEKENSEVVAFSKRARINLGMDE